MVDGDRTVRRKGVWGARERERGDGEAKWRDEGRGSRNASNLYGQTITRWSEEGKYGSLTLRVFRKGRGLFWHAWVPV